MQPVLEPSRVFDGKVIHAVIVDMSVVIKPAAMTGVNNI